MYFFIEKVSLLVINRNTMRDFLEMIMRILNLGEPKTKKSLLAYIGIAVPCF